MTFGAHLFAQLQAYRASRNGQTVTRQEWENEVDRLHEAWDAQNAPAKAPRRQNKPLSDADWIAGLKKLPEYAGIDIDGESMRCRRWCVTQSPPRLFTRRRFTNWLVKAQPETAIAPQVKTAQIPPEPAGWLEVMRIECPGWRPLMYTTPPTWGNLLPLQRQDVLRVLADHAQAHAIST